MCHQSYIIISLNECRAAFTERNTRSCTLFGNNTGACSMRHDTLLRYLFDCSHLMQFTWCLRTLRSQA
jgi:hypothetical protein